MTTPEQAFDPAVTRRRFLRGAALSGGGLVAATVAAACIPAAGAPTWTFGPNPTPATGVAQPSAIPSASVPASPGHDHSSGGPSGSPTQPDHDALALAVVKRFLDGEYGKVEGAGNQPVVPRLDGGVKVFDLSVDKISHRIDAVLPTVDALGFNGTWPGPRLEAVEGDQVRAIFTNNLDESTGIHFHGQRVPNKMDGVPHITQDPILPGVLHLRVHRQPGRLADVPLPSQRHRPGRSRALGRVHRPAQGSCATLRRPVWREPGHRLDQPRTVPDAPGRARPHTSTPTSPYAGGRRARIDENPASLKLRDTAPETAGYCW